MDTRRSPLRILAPAALLVTAVALVLIISSAGGDGKPSASQKSNAAEKARDLGSSSDGENKTPRKKRNSDRLPQKYYIVKSGDTLGSIAEKTGVPVDKLQQLNEGLDQFSLVAGQKIKLR